MGRLYITIDNEIEKKFRHKVINKYGGQKAALSKGAEEAITQWVKETKVK